MQKDCEVEGSALTLYYYFLFAALSSSLEPTANLSRLEGQTLLILWPAIILTVYRPKTQYTSRLIITKARLNQHEEYLLQQYYPQ